MPISRSAESASSSIAKYRGSNTVSWIGRRGRSSAPSSGKSGRVGGMSAGPLYSRLSFIVSDTLYGAGEIVALEPDCREFAPRCDRSRVHESPGLEELQKLLARGFVVPFAVVPDDFK